MVFLVAGEALQPFYFKTFQNNLYKPLLALFTKNGKT
jgi:hypothetical protein